MSFHRTKVAIALAATGFTVSACAAIFSGTTQQISVNTNPAGASCKFLRQGAAIAEISSTPGAATIQKTKYDINIVCSLAGYNDGNYVNHSGVAGATYADILGGIVTGGIAWGVDSASGADNKYDGQVNVTLFPLANAAPAAAAATTSSTPARTAPVAAISSTPPPTAPATTLAATDSAAPGAPPQTNDWHNRFRL